MSHALDTRTFTVSPQELPPTFSSLGDYEAFARDAGGRARGRTDGVHHLWGSTRSGWAIYLVKNLLKSAPEATSLQFLTDSGHTYVFETEYDPTSVSVLDPAAVDRAAEQLDQLLARLSADPALVYDADEAVVTVLTRPNARRRQRRRPTSGGPCGARRGAWPKQGAPRR